MNITIIIPCLNEAASISRLANRLLTVDRTKIEVIVVDGGSEDDTVKIAHHYNFKVLHCECSRAKQMNLGAQHALHPILYFVHADTLPPLSYYNDGIDALNKGFGAACYRSKYESKKPLLRINAFFTRFYWLVSKGGDQSLFITKATFETLGKFDEQMKIMEEYPLIHKLMQKKQLFIIPKPILISTRKYDNRSWIKVSRANFVAFKLFKKGVKSSEIKKRYTELLN